MKARHTFNIKSTGFDYTKTRNVENQSSLNEKNDDKSDIIISVRRPTKILNEKKKNRFQKD